MHLKRIFALSAATAVAAVGATAGVAGAAFPNFEGCPTTAPDSGCVHVQAQSGELEIKGFRVPLGPSLEIRGGISGAGGTFVPAAGTGNGVIGRPVNVPGGLLGIELPLGFTQVQATTELAGPPSSVRIEPGEQIIEMPIKVRLSNPLIGSNCHIGSNSNPVRVRLIPDTTNPPPPNRPISGAFGTPSIIPPSTVVLTGGLNVENSFSIPGASSCGLGLGLINGVINAKLGLPSAGGNNSLRVVSDVAVRFNF